MAFFLVSYDIVPDRRRTKLAKLLEGFGSRVQRSVFECDLTPPQFALLHGRITKLIKPDEGDSVRIYRLCISCVKTVEIHGPGVLETTPDVFIV